MADLHAGRDVEQFVGELLDVCRRQPRRSQSHINFRRGHVRGLNRFQRLDILGKARVGHGRRVRHGQFLPHIAGEILVVSFPLI